MCLWIFARPDGGPKAAAGRPVVRCGALVVIRGIREIRGYDQPVSRSAVIPTVLECGLYGRTPSRRCAHTTAPRSARR